MHMFCSKQKKVDRYAIFGFYAGCFMQSIGYNNLRSGKIMHGWVNIRDCLSKIVLQQILIPRIFIRLLNAHKTLM